MNPTILPFSCLVVLLILFARNQISTSAESRNLVQDTCRKAYEEPDICVAFLRTDSRSLKATSVKDLAYIMLDICIANATDTRHYFQRLRDAISDRRAKKAVELCVADYGFAVKYDFPRAKKKLNSNSYAEAKKLANNGVGRAVNCSRHLTPFLSSNSPLMLKNNILQYLGLIAEGIIKLLQGKHV